MKARIGSSDNQKKYNAHAWQHYTHVILMGLTGCSSPSTINELHGWAFKGVLW